MSNKTKNKTRSAAWAMVNWAHINNEVKRMTTFSPDHTSIEQSISEIEKKSSDEELLMKEADELENLLIKHIVNNLNQTRGKEIKRNKMRIEREQRLREKQREAQKNGVKLMRIGSLDELKDLGLDPEMMQDLSEKMLDQLFGAKKKRKSDDEDEEDEEPGSSFYM